MSKQEEIKKLIRKFDLFDKITAPLRGGKTLTGEQLRTAIDITKDSHWNKHSIKEKNERPL